MVLFHSRIIHCISIRTCVGDLNGEHAKNCVYVRKIIEKLLVIDPAERISVAKALKDDYFATFFDPISLNPEVTGPFPEAQFEAGGTIEDWKALIWEEIHSFVPED